MSVIPKRISRYFFFLPPFLLLYIFVLLVFNNNMSCLFVECGYVDLIHLCIYVSCLDTV